jgi:hypothetical protein
MESEGFDAEATAASKSKVARRDSDFLVTNMDQWMIDELSNFIEYIGHIVTRYLDS